MKKTILTIALLFTALLFAPQLTAQCSEYKKEIKKKVKTYKKEGWKHNGPRTLEAMLCKYYTKLETDFYQPIEGSVDVCWSSCSLEALGNAAILYATAANAKIEGDLNSAVEVSKFLSDYKAKVQTEINGLLELSYVVERKNADGNGKEYKAYYLVNKNEAKKARIRAMNSAGADSDIRKLITPEKLNNMAEKAVNTERA